MTNVSIMATDFSYLMRECPRCFFLKCVHKLKPPAGIFPDIFKAVNKATLETFNRAVPNIPGFTPLGRYTLEMNQFVKAQILHLSDVSIDLCAPFDLLLNEEDGGSVGAKIITTGLDDDALIDTYWLQIQSLVYCLEHPRSWRQPIKMASAGLLVYNPSAFSVNDADEENVEAILKGGLRFVKVDIERDEYLAELGNVAEFLGGGIPEPEESCAYCTFIEDSAQFSKKALAV